MGYRNADAFLDSISINDWAEWRAWRKIRGPIGMDRLDTLAAYVAMYTMGTVKGDLLFLDFIKEVRGYVRSADNWDENEVVEDEEE